MELVNFVRILLDNGSGETGDAEKEEPEARAFEIWSEGYVADGNWIGAQFIGSSVGPTFREACIGLCSSKEIQARYGRFSRKSLTLWGCRLFDNEAEARKSFG